MRPPTAAAGSAVPRVRPHAGYLDNEKAPLLDGTIFVYPDGLPVGNDPATVRSSMRCSITCARDCIDETRIFVNGQSFGALMTNFVGCSRGDMIRAIAAVAGSGPRGSMCTGDVAVWLTHGMDDMSVTFKSGEASRDFWVDANGCSTLTMPVTPAAISIQLRSRSGPRVFCELLVCSARVSRAQSFEAQEPESPLVAAHPSVGVAAKPTSRALALAQSPLTWLLLAIAVLYVTTLFPGVGGRINGGDSAKFQFIGMIGGIGHPPGSPLYMMLNALWVRLPLPCSPALRVTLLSLVFGLLALLMLARALSRSFGVRAAICGVIALALGPLYWTLATEAELYTLSATIVAGSCAAALWFERTADSRALFACAALALLGCANHLTSVMLLPAAAYMVWAARSSEARLNARQLVGLVAVGLLAMASYAYMPLRAQHALAYSEWIENPELRSFWRYVTAARFHDGLQRLTAENLMLARLPAIASELQKQWAWPVLLLLPFGFVRLRERAPRAARFVELSLIGLLAFALVYKIPDPAGFFIPIVTLLAIPLALACTEPARAWNVRAIVVAACLAIGAWQHVEKARHLIGNELVYSLGNHKFVAWDLDDVFQRIPEGAFFAQPCEAYGCVELINYFRFADQAPMQRNIQFVQLPGMQSDYYAFAPMKELSWDDGKHAVICTLREGDAKRFRKHGARIHTIDRQARDLAGKEYPGVPIHCTQP